MGTSEGPHQRTFQISCMDETGLITVFRLIQGDIIICAPLENLVNPPFKRKDVAKKKNQRKNLGIEFIYAKAVFTSKSQNQNYKKSVNFDHQTQKLPLFPLFL